MGYETRYKLRVEKENADSAQQEELIGRLRSNNNEAGYALYPDGRSWGSMKWYDHAVHMREFSKQNPDWLFTLSGEGEETGDIWKKYFLNGKMQVAKAQIFLEPFDPEKLV
jgi:hypothetical protein